MGVEQGVSGNADKRRPGTTAIDPPRTLDTKLLDFNLPEECIAQSPASRRDDARLLLANRQSGRLEHFIFRDLPDLLPDGSRLFRNNVKVIKARLRGRRPTGGEVECLLLHPAAGIPNQWWCLLKPGRRLKPGSTFGCQGKYSATVMAKSDAGQYRVEFNPANYESILQLTQLMGEMPLPPYIRRQKPDPQDSERYQTVYAHPKKELAAAAPTAGLHFSPELIDRLERLGFPFHDLTLQIGLDTFQPVQCEKVEDHPIHKEIYEISGSTLKALQPASGTVRIAVGTTSARAMEHCWTHRQAIPEVEGTFRSEADLFIIPPYRFKVTDALLTNFHLPRSTLLCLVSSYLTPGETTGIKWLKAIYGEAISLGYRFFSYGDAMLII